MATIVLKQFESGREMVELVGFDRGYEVRACHTNDGENYNLDNAIYYGLQDLKKATATYNRYKRNLNK